MSRLLFSFIVFFLFWVAFTSSLDPQELGVGALVALVIALLAGKEITEDGMKNFSFHRIQYAIRYIFVFIWEMIKANLDVAKRIIQPTIPINPGIVEIPTKLKSNVAKLALANSITLTPGTLTVDIIDDKLYIHWIDVKSEDPSENFKEISSVFEKYIKEIFE
jgi:multicomponent Na+:H+ antiporter subunit E